LGEIEKKKVGVDRSEYTTGCRESLGAFIGLPKAARDGMTASSRIETGPILASFYTVMEKIIFERNSNKIKIFSVKTISYLNRL